MSRLILGAIVGGLFAVVVAVQARTGADTIVVNQDVVKLLVREREELLGRALTAEERPAVIDRYVNDEILVREAFARELHRRDGVVRRRLLDVMRAALVEEPSEPTERELRDYLRANGDVYRVPETATFSQVYFRVEPAISVLTRLRAGADFRGLGEEFWLGHTLKAYAEAQLAQILGSSFAQQVMKLPVHEWTGPLESSRGYHFVRIDERRPPQIPSFDEIAPMVRTDWLTSKREASLAQQIDRLRGRHRVKVEPDAR